MVLGGVFLGGIASFGLLIASFGLLQLGGVGFGVEWGLW